MDPVTLSSLLMLGGSLAGRLGAFSSKPRFWGEEPRKYFKDLTFDESDLGKLRTASKTNLLESLGPSLSAIKNIGAARRLPIGATQSGLATAGKSIYPAMAGIEPQLQQMKLGSLQDYFRLQQPYTMMKSGAEMQGSQYGKDMLMGGLGNISSLLIMKEAGLI